MSFRQGIPWRVALQQSPPPLSLPTSFCNPKSRSSWSFQRTVTVDQQSVSKKGAVHSFEDQQFATAYYTGSKQQRPVYQSGGFARIRIPTVPHDARLSHCAAAGSSFLP